MNDMQHVGVSTKLDIAIRRKIYKGVDGAEVLALENLNFSLTERTFTTLIGPSGCGKTTLLRIIAGLDPIYEGKVGGAIANHRVGFVFQEPRLLPWRTIGENIALASFEGIDAYEIERLAALVGLEKAYRQISKRIIAGTGPPGVACPGAGGASKTTFAG